MEYRCMHEDNNESVLVVVKEVFLKNNMDMSEAMLYGISGGAAFHINYNAGSEYKKKEIFLSGYQYSMIQNICINCGIHHEVWNYNIIKRNMRRIAEKLNLPECIFVNKVIAPDNNDVSGIGEWGFVEEIDLEAQCIKIRWHDAHEKEDIDVDKIRTVLHCFHFPERELINSRKLIKIINSNSIRFLYQKEKECGCRGISDLIQLLKNPYTVTEKDWTINYLNRKLYSQFLTECGCLLKDSYYEEIAVQYMKIHNMWKLFFDSLNDYDNSIELLNKIYNAEKCAALLLIEHTEDYGKKNY